MPSGLEDAVDLAGMEVREANQRNGTERGPRFSVIYRCLSVSSRGSGLPRSSPVLLDSPPFVTGGVAEVFAIAGSEMGLRDEAGGEGDIEE